MEQAEIISRIVEKIKEGYNPRKIILFGSYARGNPTEDSDIDLLIIKETNKRRDERFVDVNEILKKGVVLYDRDSLGLSRGYSLSYSSDDGEIPQRLPDPEWMKLKKIHWKS